MKTEFHCYDIQSEKSMRIYENIIHHEKKNKRKEKKTMKPEFG